MALVAAGVLASAPPISAQRVDIDAIKQSVETSAAEFADLRALLRHPDENIRLAAFDAMVGHGDPSLYELASATALGDASDVVRARALWEVLSRRANFTLLIDPEGTLDDEEAARAVADEFHGRQNYAVAGAFPANRCISLYQAERCDPRYSIGLSGTVASFTYNPVSGQLALDADGLLRGTLRHQSLGVAFPATIRLR